MKMTYGKLSPGDVVFRKTFNLKLFCIDLFLTKNISLKASDTKIKIYHDIFQCHKDILCCDKVLKI